jgi:hypothetical protein
MADLGTVTVTEETFNKIKKITFAWTSDSLAGGKATKTTDNVYTGEIIRLVTVPGTGGDAPDPNYDVILYDEDTTDTLMSAGLNRHTSNTEQVLASSLGCVVNDKLSLSIIDAGNANTGTVYVYIK